MEAIRRELEAHLIGVEAGNRRAGGDGPVANITTVKLPKFNDATNWAVFRRQFETAEVQSNWTENEKSTHLFSVLQGQAADILHTVLTKGMCEDIVVAFRDSFGKQQLAASYRSQLNASVHKSGGRYRICRSSGAAGTPRPCRASSRLFSKRAAHAYIDGIRDRELKQLLLKAGYRTINEALYQAMKMEASRAAANSPARKQKLTYVLARASQLSDRRNERQPQCWQCGSAAHLRIDRWRGSRERDKDSGN